MMEMAHIQVQFKHITKVREVTITPFGVLAGNEFEIYIHFDSDLHIRELKMLLSFPFASDVLIVLAVI